jgi:23S rRNA pseudouridine1911/1915/1917 synthase
MPTQEDASGDTDLLSALKEDIKRRYQKPGNVYLGLVHRLDRPAGGVMVFAKTSKAASRLSEAVRTRSFEKTYVAVLCGKPAQPQGRLVHYLLKDSRTNTVSVVDGEKAGAKKAVLDYTIIAGHGNLQLAGIQLHTGRPHQIRVQFASIGCPLFGDQKYNNKQRRPGQQMALWAIRLSFPHPVGKQWVSFSSKPPDRYPWNLWDADWWKQIAEKPWPDDMQPRNPH